MEFKKKKKSLAEALDQKIPEGDVLPEEVEVGMENLGEEADCHENSACIAHIQPVESVRGSDRAEEVKAAIEAKLLEIEALINGAFTEKTRPPRWALRRLDEFRKDVARHLDNLARVQ